MASANSRALCAHCKKNKAAQKKRGLCRACYDKPEIKCLFPRRKPGNPPTDVSVRFWNKVQKCSASACWIWTGQINVEGGYGYIAVGSRPNWSMKLAHRLSYELNCGPIGDLHVLHRCDNRKCVKPTHLFLGTNDDNVRDMMNKGRNRKGERVAGAKMTAAKVVELRTRVAAGESCRTVAEEVGLSVRQAKDIVNGKAWKHLL